MQIQNFLKLSSALLLASLIMSNALACDSNADTQQQSQPQPDDEPQTD